MPLQLANEDDEVSLFTYQGYNGKTAVGRVAYKRPPGPRPVAGQAVQCSAVQCRTKALPATAVTTSLPPSRNNY